MFLCAYVFRLFNWDWRDYWDLAGMEYSGRENGKVFLVASYELRVAGCGFLKMESKIG